MADIELDLDVPSGTLAEVVAVLHAAFSQFGEGGKPSGALVHALREDAHARTLRGLACRVRVVRMRDA
jgi:hypothetical protein